MRKAPTSTRLGSALAATIATAALATLTVSLPATEAPVAATAVPDPFLWLDATNPDSYPGTGLTWFDRSANASHGALSGPSAGSITFDAANSALNFPGGVNGTAYLDLPGNFRDFGSGVTIEFEGHFGSNLSAWERIFDFAGPGSLTDALFVSRLGADNELAVGLYTSATGPNLLQGHCYTATNNTALAAGATFQKWLVTIDNAGLCRIYRNGVELPTRLHTSGSFNTASAGANLAGSALGVPRTTDRTFAYLGRSTFPGDGDLEGSIRYLRMFNQALTPTQVQAVSTATVTFDANGGGGIMAPQSSTVSATLRTNTFSRTSNEFLGWNTEPDGTGFAYADQASYPFASNTTLYAQWQPPVAPPPVLWLDATNPDSYPGTGLTWFDRSANASHGALTGPSVSAITFDAANASLNFPGGDNGDAFVDLPGNFRDFSRGLTLEFEGHFGSLTAWERIFDFAQTTAPQGGSAANGMFVSRLFTTNELTITLLDGVTSLGHCHTATDNTAMASGATFQKWLITIDNTALKRCRIYRDGTELPTRFNNDPPNFVTASAGANVAGSAFALPPVADRTLAFVGRSNWPVDADLEGSIRYIRLFDRALTPTQVQAVSTATVTFDANGGGGIMAPQSSTVSATLLPNAFGRSFHEFVGWNTAADGTGLSYADASSYPFSSDVTLYAQWSLIPGSLPEPLTTLPVPTTTVPETTVPETTVPETTQPATPQPVLDNEGVLRELAAGETLVTEAGEEVPVEVVKTPEAVALEGDDFAIRVEGSPGGSTIELEPGGTVRVSGFGFQPASQVDVWLFSDPTYLGALTVAADGTFEGSLPVPVLAPGEHTLQVNGLSSDGQVRSTSVGLVVLSVVAPEPVTDTLPATGSSSGSTLAVVMALLALGTLVLATRRRKAFPNA